MKSRLASTPCGSRRDGSTGMMAMSSSKADGGSSIAVTCKMCFGVGVF